MDENPVDPVALKLTVNGRYPDTVPLTTIPPQVLQTLPKLTEDLEYRFIGDWLILLDIARARHRGLHRQTHCPSN